MNKEKFNELDIDKQIEYFNLQLKYNKSITSVTKELGIGRSTIRDRFKKHSYNYSKELNQYILDNDNITDVIQEDDTLNYVCVTPVIDDEKEAVDMVNEVITLSDDNIKTNLLNLANDYEILKELIELHRRNTSVIKQQIVIDIEDAESKLTTLRVNSKILDNFNKFCDNNKQYKKVDLLSQALKEFIEKYR